MRDGAEQALSGAALEQRIAALLRSFGYAVTTNEIVEGRSGARHEIDVLGHKSDGFATFSVAVECKAWERPIEKDVVAKFAFVLGDIGVREGIIVCLGGHRSGAEIAARETGIELWGPDELARRLGDVAVAELASGTSRWTAGLAPQISDERARQLAERSLRSGLVGRGERITTAGRAWLPAAVVQIAVSRWEGRRRPVLQTRRMWNAYELIDGTLLASWTDPPDVVDVDVGAAAVPPRHKDSAPARAIATAVAKHGAVTTAAATERAARRLDELAIPTGYDVLTEATTSIVVPLYVALATRRDAERVVAVDLSRGWVDPELGAVLSRNVHWMRSAITGADHSGGFPAP